MANPTYENYVAVFFSEGDNIVTKFVTALQSHNWTEWHDGEPAMKMSESCAKDVVFGLTLNGYAAAVVKVLKGVTFRNPEKKEEAKA